MMKRKPGRPRGTRNKLKQVVMADRNNRNDVISDFERTLKEWDRMDQQIDWEQVAKKQEQAIEIYKLENEDLAKICIQRWEEIQNLKYLVSYLERRIENASI